MCILINVPLTLAFLAGACPVCMYLMDVYLISMHLITVHLISAHLITVHLLQACIWDVYLNSCISYKRIFPTDVDLLQACISQACIS